MNNGINLWGFQKEKLEHSRAFSCDITLVSRIQKYTEESGSGGVLRDSSFCGDLGERECMHTYTASNIH